MIDLNSIPHRIVFISQKGGVGKSTMAFLMANAFAESSLSVGFMDHDPQAALTMMLAGDDRVAPPRDGCKVLIIDTPGHLDLDDQQQRDRTAQILSAATRIVVVSGVDGLSVRAARLTAEFVKATKPAHASVFACFSRVRAGTALAKQDLSMLGNAIGLPHLNSFLPERAAYMNAATSALAPTEIKKSNGRQIGWGILPTAEKTFVLQLANELITS